MAGRLHSMATPGAVVDRREAVVGDPTDSSSPVRLYSDAKDLARALLVDDPLDAAVTLTEILGPRPPAPPALPDWEPFEAADLKLDCTVLAFELKREIRDRVVDTVPVMQDLRNHPKLRRLQRILASALTKLIRDPAPAGLAPPWDAVWPIVGRLLAIKYAERLEDALHREIERHLEKVAAAMGGRGRKATNEFECAMTLYKHFRPRFDPLVDIEVGRMQQAWTRGQNWIARIDAAERWIGGES